MERLLLYSLERNSPIRMIFMDNGKYIQRNVQVEEINADSVAVYVLRSRKHISILKSDILSVDFRKNDDNLK